MKQAKSIDLSVDGRCDSPEHNAEYLTYSFMDKSRNNIGAFSLTQVTEAGNSNRMEKMGFEKTLKSFLLPLKPLCWCFSQPFNYCYYYLFNCNEFLLGQPYKNQWSSSETREKPRSLSLFLK